MTDEVINVNPATKGARERKNVTTIKSSFDPVSILHKKKRGDITIHNRTYNPLTEHSANVLDRVDYHKRIGK